MVFPSIAVKYRTCPPIVGKLEKMVLLYCIIHLVTSIYQTATGRTHNKLRFHIDNSTTRNMYASKQTFRISL